MVEKVLGFIENNSLQDNHKNFFGEISLVIPKSKLVPVVLFRWLKKYCKERIGETDSSWDAGYVQALKDLLSAAKKEVDKDG